MRRGIFGKKTFFILFGIYFSSLAIASTLTVEFIGALIPGGNNNTPIGNTPAQQCRGSDTNKTLLANDRTQVPTDIAFNNDGSFVYTTNFQTNKMNNNTVIDCVLYYTYLYYNKNFLIFYHPLHIVQLYLPRRGR